MDWKFWKKNNVNTLNEANEEFKNKVKVNKETQGEGIEDFTGLGIGVSSLSSFSGFYNRYINQVFKTEREKIYKYRDMANMPEISDVIEDAVIESTQENSDDTVIALELKDGDLSKNKNIVNTLNEEFNKLFFDRLKIDNLLWNGMLTYFIDGRVYFERVKGPKDNGIVKLKKLPSESMDFDYDQYGNITAFYQYLTPNAPKPNGIEDAKDKDDVIAFYPEQITFIHTGYFGMSKKNIIGYLEKCTQAFNQLKMLETSLIIYRIVRAPERLVFKIDTGNMPKDKAMKYIDKVARKFKQKQTYNQQTGQIESQTAITSILENYFIGQCIRLNTKIKLYNNEEKTLEEIISDFKNGIKNYTYTVDQTNGNIIKGEIEWAGVTRKNAEMVRVWLENDQYLDVTPDHKFCVWEDETKTKIIEVEAQHLTEEMDLVENI